MEQISPQVRLVAIVGLVVAFLGGGAMMLMNRGAAAEAAGAEVVAGPLKVAEKAKGAAAAAARRNAAVAPTPEATPAAKPEPAPTPDPGPAATSAPARKPKPAPASAVDANGLPMSIAAALRRHDVVVVSLFTPGGGVDGVAVEEARAGAARAEAGFVAVNVLDRRQGEPLTKLLGVQGAPAVLVYRAPAELAFRFEGFLDLATVAAAALGARP